MTTTRKTEPLNLQEPIELLKVISVLLSYPTADLQQCTGQLQEIITSAREIPSDQRRQLLNCLQQLTGRELMDVQEDYDQLFERGRQLSLLLFEHVHGESRDRGQAMVDLMAQYEQHGLVIEVPELPDYIPLYLEYLAQCDGIEARQGLADVAHILALLNARLLDRGEANTNAVANTSAEHYASCFQALLTISGADLAMDSYTRQAAQEQPDNTLAAMDKEWEEQLVTFGAAGDPAADSCGSRPRQAKQPVAEPVHFTDGYSGQPSSTDKEA